MSDVQSNITSILCGVDELIDLALGVEKIGKPPHHKHVRSQKLATSRSKEFNAKKLIADIHNQLSKNFRKADANPRSKENWRDKRQVAYEKDKATPEIRLERRIVNLVKEDFPDIDNWYNQVPVASGLTSPDADRRRCIDLVHKCDEDTYEFIELKCDSDTPLFAAMEILKYGSVYISYRQRVNQEKKLLQAKRIHLKVLAPAQFYAKCNLGWLEVSISQGLEYFLKQKQFDLEMNFKFEVLNGIDCISDAIKAMDDKFLAEQLSSRTSVIWNKNS